MIELWKAALAAVPGIIALIAWAVGYGKLQERLTNVEREVDKLSNLATEVAVVNERTKHIDDSMKKMEGTLERLSTHLLDNALDAIRHVRSFAPPR